MKTPFVRKARKRFFPALVLSLSLFTWAAAHAQITPLSDSYTNTADSTTNFGSKTVLDVDGATQITYIQFNLASIPSGASITQATLKLYVNSVASAGTFNVDYVNGAWAESTIDASNAPALGAAIASDVNVTTADKNQYILVNVTSAVQAWLSGTETNNGLALVANSTFNATFDSKENTTTSHPPELDIAFAGGSGTITGVTTASGSGLTGGGTSGTLSLGLTESCSKNEVLQWSGSTWACASAGTGTITGVTAGTDLTGGGTSGSVTLNLNTSALNSTYAQLAAANTFTGNQTVQSGTLTAQGGTQTATAAVVAVGSDGHNASFYPSLAAGDFNGIVQAGDPAIIYSWGTPGIGSLVIAPWSDATSGLRMNSDGQVYIGTATAGAGGEANLYVEGGWGFVVDDFGSYCEVLVGDLMCTGTKNAVVPVDDGKRWVGMSAIESPVNWFEDAGSAKLVNGVAVVELDPTFIQTVNSTMDYKVFPVPNGDCKGLYVTNKTATSFAVHELGGGTSSVDFDYRIMAIRKNYETVRFADRTRQVEKIRGGHGPIKPTGTKSPSLNPAKVTPAAPARAALTPNPQVTTSR